MGVGSPAYDHSNKKILREEILNKAIEFPKSAKLSTNLKDLITRLLVKDPALRLGCGGID